MQHENPGDRALDDRLKAIEARLARLERQAGLAPVEPARGIEPGALPQGAPAGFAAAESHAVGVMDSSRAPAAFVPPPGSMPAAPVAPPTAPARKAVALRAPQDRPARDPSLNWEQLIGGRWYLIGGALVVVIGVGLFLKYAYDQGWLGRLPAGMKCLLAAGFGAMLLGGAEVLRRRVNAWASVGLNAAGLGTLFAAAYAAGRVFALVNDATTFALLAGTWMLGLLIAWRTRLVTVAIISILGGYAAPFLIGGGGREWVLPIYWIMLLAVGVGAAAVGRGAFAVLRWITLAGTMLLGAIWIIGLARNWPMLSTSYLGAAWALAHLELILAARDRESADGGAPSRRRRGRIAVPASSSIGMTCWAAVLGVFIARHSTLYPDWMAPLALAGTALGLGVTLAGHLRFFVDAPATPGEKLGAGMMVQVAALLIGAIALGISGSAQVLMWLALGAAAVGGGRWTRSAGLAVYGVVLLTIGAARLLAWDSWRGPLAVPADNIHGLVVSPWMGLVLLAAGAWIAAAAFLAWRGPAQDDGSEPARDTPEQPARRAAALACSGVGVALALSSFIHAEARAEAVAFAWFGAACAFAAAGWFERRLGLVGHACWALVASCGAWSIAFAFDRWDTFRDPFVLHRGLILAVMLAPALRTCSRRAFSCGRAGAMIDSAPARIAGAAVGAVLLFAATSFEAARIAAATLEGDAARAVAVSVWWGVFALIVLAAGYVRGLSPVRLAALGLLAVAAVKAVVFDIGPTVSAGGRAISVLVLGLFMLGVGVAYAKLSRGAAKARDDAPLPAEREPPG